MDKFILKTKDAQVTGIEKENCLEFRGIRYARAKRFEYPTVEPFDGEIDATKFGACCFQHRAFEDDAKVNPFYHKEFRKGLEFTYSEDCFFLNIWTPKKAENCPVVIFIHGGSFTGGSSDENYIKGDKFAKDGVVMVAMNYRLGPYGFCAHEKLKDENGVCGNYGLADQAAAVEWVIENIASFGGNPKRIILMGQSAGAMSVDIHLTNPALKGKISGAVLLSGAGLQRCVLKPQTIEKNSLFWDKVMQSANVSSPEQLKDLDAKELFYAWKKVYNESKTAMIATLPVYDGKIIQKETFDLHHIPDIPYIIGTTCTDMMPIALEMIAKKWSKAANSKNAKPCFIYNFNRELPGDNKGAWHSADLLYLFATLKTNWRPFEKIDYQISNELSGAMAAFAKNLNPNCELIPEWKADYKAPMSFCEKTKADKWKTASNIKYTFSKKGKTF